jgi:hypothetical protein
MNAHLTTPLSSLWLGSRHDKALGHALEATTRVRNQRNSLLGREAPFVFFTRRPGPRDKDAGVGDTLQGAPTGALHGACTIAATAFVQRKCSCGVATGGPRVGFTREGLKDGATEPGAEVAVAQGAVGLVSTIVRASDVYQVRFIDTAKASQSRLGTTKPPRRTVRSLRASALIPVMAKRVKGTTVTLIIMCWWFVFVNFFFVCD